MCVCVCVFVPSILGAGLHTPCGLGWRTSRGWLVTHRREVTQDHLFFTPLTLFCGACLHFSREQGCRCTFPSSAFLRLGFRVLATDSHPTPIYSDNMEVKKLLRVRSSIIPDTLNGILLHGSNLAFWTQQYRPVHKKPENRLGVHRYLLCRTTFSGTAVVYHSPLGLNTLSYACFDSRPNLL